MLQEDINNILIIFSIMLLVPIAMILLFIVFNNRKNKLIRTQLSEKKRFEYELAESKIETREETLRNISWELHDNIGQLLTLAKIQLQNSNNDPIKINESIQTLGQALIELRSLSKSINPEGLKSMSILETINNEIERFNRIRYIKSELKIVGAPFEIPKKEETIIFRILQEFFSNTIRHSKATELVITFEFGKNELKIRAKDNGIGFKLNGRFGGIGLKNMKNRAHLIGFDFNIMSSPGQGTELIMNKKYLQKQKDETPDSNR